MTLLGVVLTVVVLLAVAAAILVFERPRARRIERDLRDEARRRRAADRSADGSDSQG
jgi:hypothetical protein